MHQPVFGQTEMPVAPSEGLAMINSPAARKRASQTAAACAFPADNCSNAIFGLAAVASGRDHAQRKENES